VRKLRAALLACVAALVAWQPAEGRGQEAGPVAVLVRVIDTSAWSPPSPDPTDVAYARAIRKLVVVDGEVEETSLFQGANAFRARPNTGALQGAFDLTGITREPAGVAVPGRSRRTLYVSDDNADRIFIIRAGPDRRWGTEDDRVRSISTRAFGSADPEGLGFGLRSLFVADGSATEIFRIRRRGAFDGPPPDGDDVVTSFDTAGLGLSEPEGVDLDPASGHLFIVSRREKVIVEVTLRGRPVARYDVSASGIEEPSGLAVARAEDGGLLLYVSDRGVDNNEDPAENDGRIFVFSVAPTPG